MPPTKRIATRGDPRFKKKLVEATNETPDKKALGTEARPQPYEWLFVFDTVEGPHRSVAEVAAERGVHPAQAMIDLALEKDLDLFFLMPVANEDQDDALEIMKHPRACVKIGRASCRERGEIGVGGVSWRQEAGTSCSIATM